MVIHGLPQWKIEVGNSRLQFVPMNAEFDFKNELIFLKVLIVQKVKDVFVDCGRGATLSHISCSSSLAPPPLLFFPCSSSLAPLPLQPCSSSLAPLPQFNTKKWKT